MDYRLDTIALAVSQHYKLMKSIVTSGFDMRMPTREEAELADYLASVIERVGGKAIADYCRAKFQNGWMSHDLRSYKIKLVLVRLRNHLKDSSAIKNELLERLGSLTEHAETMAGCISDDKRRNRKAREARRLKREQEAASHGVHQMDLFEYAESSGSSSPESQNPSCSKAGASKDDLGDIDDIDDIDLDVRLVGGRSALSSSRRTRAELLGVAGMASHTKSNSETPRRRRKSDGSVNSVRERKDQNRAKKFANLTRYILNTEYGDEEGGEDDIYTETDMPQQETFDEDDV